MKKSVVAIVIKSFALLVVFGTAGRAMAQDVATAYLKMVPIEQYLMDGILVKAPLADPQVRLHQTFKI